MATRITEPKLDSTEKLLEQILLVILRGEQRAQFLCPAGDGEAILQRVRVYISRERKKLLEKGETPKQFLLRSTIHKETHGGTRYDACVVWKDVSDMMKMKEDLSRLLKAPTDSVKKIEGVSDVRA